MYDPGPHWENGAHISPEGGANCPKAEEITLTIQLYLYSANLQHKSSQGALQCEV